MKRLKYGVLVLMTFAFMVFGAQSVMAAETGTTSDGFTWMYEEGTMAVTGYSGDATVITIPATINGKPVTMIYSQSSSESGFSSKLTSVTIPNTVTTIGNSAFDGCSSLTSVTIPNSVTMIGEWAFGYCSSLTGLTIPNSVIEIGDSAFFVCSGLKSATIPHSVIIIGDSAFSGCSSLTSVTIPDSVTKIGSMAFSGCSSLTSVTIPNSVTEIGFYVFYVCRSLTSVTIPNSVTEIGYYSFYGCSSLSNVTIPSTVTTIYEKAFGYYKNALDQEKTVPGFTINGYYGTCAEKYAKDNAFTFIGTKSNIGDVAKVEGVNSEYDYTGDEIKPTISLDGAFTFTEGVDYTVSYKKNKNPGTASIIVKGINNYTGTVKKNFKIKSSSIYSLRPSKLKAKVKKGKVSVSWKNVKKTKKNKKLLKKITSIEVQYSTDKKFKKNKTVNYYSKATNAMLKLKRKKTYYIRIRYRADDGVSKWSSVKKVKTK